MNEDEYSGPLYMVEEYNHAASEVTLHSEWDEREQAIIAYLELLEAHGIIASGLADPIERKLETGESYVTTVGNYGLSINTITN